uniref:Uncharacterized protein n=1 Tax=Strigamia maritima TaxID=126957 RepID=T1JGD7_STRMM
MQEERQQSLETNRKRSIGHYKVDFSGAGAGAGAGRAKRKSSEHFEVMTRRITRRGDSTARYIRFGCHNNNGRSSTLKTTAAAMTTSPTAT